VALAIGVHARLDQRRRGLLTAALLGGVLSLGVGLCAYGVDVVTGARVFASSGTHPVFDGLPRFVGTSGGSAQRAGSFALYLVALALAGRGVVSLWLVRTALGLGLCALGLSMSFAWLGGAALFALAAPRRLRPLALAALVLAIGAASVPLLRGPRSAALEGDCAALDAEHYLVVAKSRTRCLRLVDSGRAITRYAEAKRAAFTAFIESPLFGAGYRGFAEFAERAFVARYGQSGEHYEQPHGLLPGLAAKHGLLGALLVPLWLWLLQRGWRASPFDAAVIAFLVLGLYFDVDRLRELWALWGFMVADQGSRVEGSRGSDGDAERPDAPRAVARREPGP
jgi:hypothetical protein